MATLLPAAAMRPRRPAEPVSWVRMVEKVSDWEGSCHVSKSVHYGMETWGRGTKGRTVLSMTSWALALS